MTLWDFHLLQKEQSHFAAADPARVIPASIIGAAIAGGLSMFFGVQLPAPHGDSVCNPRGYKPCNVSCINNSWFNNYSFYFRIY